MRATTRYSKASPPAAAAAAAVSTRAVNNRDRLFHRKLASISTRLAIFGAPSQLVRFLPVGACHRDAVEFPSCSSATPGRPAAITHRRRRRSVGRPSHGRCDGAPGWGKPVSEMNLVSAPLSMQTRDKQLQASIAHRALNANSTVAVFTIKHHQLPPQPTHPLPTDAVCSLSTASVGFFSVDLRA